MKRVKVIKLEQVRGEVVKQVDVELRTHIMKEISQFVWLQVQRRVSQHVELKIFWTNDEES